MVSMLLLFFEFLENFLGFMMRWFKNNGGNIEVVGCFIYINNYFLI